MKQLLCILLALMLASSLQAQLTIIERKHAPRHPEEGTWWYSPRAEDPIHVYRNGAWQLVDVGATRAPQPWHGLVLIYDGEDRAVANPEGKLYLEWGRRLFGKDSVWGSNQNEYGKIVLNYHGDTLSMFTNFREQPRGLKPGYWVRPVLRTIEWDTIGEHIGACLPQYNQALMREEKEELRNFGILSTKGVWIIEPKFDEPFYFEDGVAEVVYYGEKRKINVKGEWVD